MRRAALALLLALATSGCLNFDDAYGQYCEQQGNCEQPEQSSLTPETKPQPRCNAELCLISEAELPNLRAARLWGASPESVWAAGQSYDANAARVVRWNGSEWGPALSPTGGPLFAISGLNDAQVVAVGQDGHVFNWNGSVWEIAGTTTYTPLKPALLGVQFSLGISRAVGEQGVIFRRQTDGTWHEELSGTQSVTLNDVHSAGGLMVAVGKNAEAAHPTYVLEKREGAPVSSKALLLDSELRRVWVVDDEQAFAVGSDGLVLRRDSAGWSREPLPYDAPLEAIWASSADDVWVAGWSRTVYRRTAAGWNRVDLDEILPSSNIKDIIGFGSSELWIVSEQTDANRFVSTRVFRFRRK